jgi:hypothetical protein
VDLSDLLVVTEFYRHPEEIGTISVVIPLLLFIIQEKIVSYLDNQPQKIDSTNETKVEADDDTTY